MMPSQIDPITILFVVLSGLLLPPMLVFCAECLLSILPKKRESSAPTPNESQSRDPVIAVLMPAHNEESVIAATLQRLMPTLPPGARVLVVADNCTDRTAEIARRAGAEVVERGDAARRGKGYALDFGLTTLAADPPDVVFVLDADCSVQPDTVALLGRRAFQLGRPVQGLNLSERSPNAAGMQAVSDLAFRFKNLVRPTGLQRAGLPCHLMGTGMALPWSIFRRHAIAGDHLAEDMQLGVDLALAGFPTVLCAETGITSRLPEEASAFVSQRTRWEQGHLRTSITQVPRLLRGAWTQRRWDLLGLALDLTVPPLSLLMALYGTGLGLSIVASLLLGTSWGIPLVLAAAGILLAASLFLGWFVHCRREAPLRTLLTAPIYILRKLPIYCSFFFNRRQKAWVRTARDSEAAARTPAAELSPGRTRNVHPLPR